MIKLTKEQINRVICKFRTTEQYARLVKTEIMQFNELFSHETEEKKKILWEAWIARAECEKAKTLTLEAAGLC